MKKDIRPRITVILLNWNNTDETLECLHSLKGVHYPFFDVLIVDNNSQDNSLERLDKIRRETREYKITIVRNTDNLGFAGGNNTGIRHALTGGADYILVLNNDTVVAPDFLDVLVREAEGNPRAGVFAPAIYFYYQPKLLWFGGKTSVSWLKMHQSISCDLFMKELPATEDNQEVSFITGCAMLFRAETLKQAAGFDKRYFLYFEDADLSFRIARAGWGLMWVPQAKIWHKVSATNLTQVGSPKMHYYHTRNILLLSKTHAPAWMALYRPAWAAYTAGKQVVKIMAGRNREVSRAIMKGILDYYRGRFGKYA